MKHSQRGFSLIELSIVLAIIAVVIAGAITGVQSILRANNVNKTIATTNRAVGAIIAKYIRDPDYSGVIMTNLTNPGMDVWDPKYITTSGTGATATTTVSNDFGGQVLVASLGTATGSIAKDQAFVYTIGNVPVAACVDIALGIESLGVAMSIVNSGTTVLSNAKTALDASPALVKDQSTKIKTSAVATACGTGATASISLVVPRS